MICEEAQNKAQQVVLPGDLAQVFFDNFLRVHIENAVGEGIAFFMVGRMVGKKNSLT